jgi:hypothetical protein
MGSSAYAQSNTAQLAAQTFINTCVETNGNAQLARLALTRSNDFTQKKRPSGLLGKDPGTPYVFLSRDGTVQATVKKFKIGKDICNVSIPKTNALAQTNQTIAQTLAQSPLASSREIESRKKRKHTMYIVKFGDISAIVSKSAVGKNSVITLR